MGRTTTTTTTTPNTTPRTSTTTAKTTTIVTERTGRTANEEEDDENDIDIEGALDFFQKFKFTDVLSALNTNKTTSTTTKRPTERPTQRTTRRTTLRTTPRTTRRTTTTTTRRTTRRTTPRTTPTTTQKTTTRTTTTTTTTTEEEEDNTVLDFSSGEAKVVENTVEKIEKKSNVRIATGAKNQFTKFQELIDTTGVADIIDAAGNVTIFSPLNKAFEEMTTKIDDVPLATVQKWILKHFVKGYLFRRDMENGQLVTLGGEFITISKNPRTNKVKVFSNSGKSKVKVANIKTKFGLVHVIDKVLT